ncbi:MAG: hypothetical protein HY823_14050 [Acidobacteria bacterium]|nr:hypothetical protein [Acidobacteriota bacterium]
MRALLLVLLLAPLFGQAPFPPGEVVPRVPCTARPAFSYALYLPPGYREDRSWPVLFAFSPGGAGEEPVRLFRKAAERFGWIVVGSNDSRNGPLRPALEASAEMWEDVHARFKVDPKRSCAVGFSGGARMAMRLALRHPKAFSGLISIGAFGTGEGFLTGLGHLDFLLLSGQEDFNHWELLEGRRELQSRGWRALADRFEGGHRWPPEAVAETLLGLVELGAMRKGLKAPDPALESELRRHLAAQAEAAGNSALALRRCQELAALFPEAPEGRQAQARAAALGKDPAVLEELRLEERYLAEARELAEVRSESVATRRLQALVERVRAAPPLEQRMIRRLLGRAFAACYGLLAEAYEKKAWDRVLAFSTTMAALDEREGWPCIYAAAAQLQLGRRPDALLHLRSAQLRGYAKPERLRALEELKPLHGDPEFEAILKEMAAGKGP